MSNDGTDRPGMDGSAEGTAAVKMWRTKANELQFRAPKGLYLLLYGFRVSSRLTERFFMYASLLQSRKHLWSLFLKAQRVVLLAVRSVTPADVVIG